ncbi:MAG: hypothetical protein ABIN96_16600, partial [Rubrivivax sp.]
SIQRQKLHSPHHCRRNTPALSVEVRRRDGGSIPTDRLVRASAKSATTDIVIVRLFTLAFSVDEHDRVSVLRHGLWSLRWLRDECHHGRNPAADVQVDLAPHVARIEC